MKKLHYIAIPCFAALLLAGCSDFLDELPTKSTNVPVENLDQLEALLDNPTYRVSNEASIWSTDDTGISTQLHDARPYEYGPMYHYTFNTNDVPNLASDATWSQTYAGIFKANLVINSLDQVTGDANRKAMIKADAHFNRAVQMWELANTYCLPYHPDNMGELGLPKRIGTSMTEEIGRMTLAETYAMIDQDIEEALKINVDQVDVSWRTSKAGIHAFLSRYYLHRGEYDKVIEAADYALTHMGPKVFLKDYNEIVAGRSATYPVSGSSITVIYSELNDYNANKVVNWPEFIYLRTLYNANQWYVPSPSLHQAFEPHKDYDLRFKWFMVENGSLRMSVSDPLEYRYTQFSDGQLLMSGTTVQEVMLNKAEALLRKASPDIAGAVAIINELRAKRFDPACPELVLQAPASAMDALLNIVLPERRRELAFAYRWWDIRRFAWNETPEDDVVVTRDFYEVTTANINKNNVVTYTLPVKSRRYAVPINGVDIDASNGVLQQNVY